MRNANLITFFSLLPIFINKLILENSIETTGLNLINYKQNVSDQRTYKNRRES